MRKVWLTCTAIAALTVATALPAMAAVPQGNCPNSLNWSSLQGLVTTQPTVRSLPGNGAPVLPSGNTGTNSQISGWSINDLMGRLQGQLQKYFAGFQGNVTCPAQNSNSNQ